MSNSDAIFDKAPERTLWSCIDREGGCRAASLPNSAALAVHFPPTHLPNINGQAAITPDEEGNLLARDWRTGE